VTFLLFKSNNIYCNSQKLYLCQRYSKSIIANNFEKYVANEFEIFFKIMCCIFYGFVYNETVTTRYTHNNFLYWKFNSLKIECHVHIR